jgi:hypothetical protein
MEIKWIAIAVGMFFVMAFGGLAVSEWAKYSAIGTCMATPHRTAEECSRIR